LLWAFWNFYPGPPANLVNCFIAFKSNFFPSPSYFFFFFSLPPLGPRPVAPVACFFQRFFEFAPSVLRVFGMIPPSGYLFGAFLFVGVTRVPCPSLRSAPSGDVLPFPPFFLAFPPTPGPTFSGVYFFLFSSPFRFVFMFAFFANTTFWSEFLAPPLTPFFWTFVFLPPPWVSSGTLLQIIFAGALAKEPSESSP